MHKLEDEKPFLLCVTVTQHTYPKQHSQHVFIAVTEKHLRKQHTSYKLIPSSYSLKFNVQRYGNTTKGF